MASEVETAANTSSSTKRKKKSSKKGSVEQNEASPEFSLAQRIARGTARHPLKALLGSLVFATLLSYIGIGLGEFSIAVDNDGWRSRGTLVSMREMQNEVLSLFRKKLFQDRDGSVWEDLQNNVQIGYRDLGDTAELRRLQSLPFGSTCNPTKYYGSDLFRDNLFAVYKAEPDADLSTVSILEPEVLLRVCEAERETQQALQQNGVCGGCEGEQCLPPLSLVLSLRAELNGFNMTCNELIQAYIPIEDQFTNSLVKCTNEVLDQFDPTTSSYGETEHCPSLFSPTMIDGNFGVNGNKILRYTSSYFITFEADDQKVYDMRDEYGQTEGVVLGVSYDTSWETQNEIYVDNVLLSDMTLALTSLFITFAAICVHTKSLWLTLMGILQLIYAIPLSYFFYYFICRLKFFPFLNFIGVFVAAALGADGVFVAVDKWKNARISNPTGSTEDIAAVALPDAASAMLLTTSTTAVAFFATLICPVAPIFCFALFCGLMIAFNYLLNMLFVFPALCCYDIWLMRGSTNCLVTFACCTRSLVPEEEENLPGRKRKKQREEESEESMSLIHRILTKYYYFLHKFRYPLVVMCSIVAGICLWIALDIKLPDSADVRLLPESNVLELHFLWKANLLSVSLFTSGSTTGWVTWGLIAADTGKLNEVESLSTLELDEDFSASTTEAQTYLLNFCDKLFMEDFVSPVNFDVECNINQFDDWLKLQSASDSPTDEYLSFCDNAGSLPMSEKHFDDCLISWSRLTGEKTILGKIDKVKTIQMRIKLETRWDAPYADMDKFWNTFEDWMEIERNVAPKGVNKMFHSAAAFWWYDTNASMLETAIGAAGIALAFSTVVVLLSSRSPSLTLFSSLCILYVLAATTASLVGLGWSLGFLESVCFSILIGISCDFVIHFGHAYIHSKGSVSRNERAKFALIHMGPSILAASFTTIAAATVMLFCQVTFFRKFALILFMTILHATIGSFVIYIVLADAFGPGEPTKYFDLFEKKLKDFFCGSEKNDEVWEQEAAVRTHLECASMSL